MDLVFALYDNTMQSLRYIIDSASTEDHHLAQHPLAKVLIFLQKTCSSIFSGQYFSGMNGLESEQSDDLIDLSTDWNVEDGGRYGGGKLWKKLSVKQTQKQGLVRNLYMLPEGDAFLLEVRRAYLRVFNSKPPLTALKELGAVQWWTKLTVFDNTLKTRLSIRTGNILSFRVSNRGREELVPSTFKMC